MAMVMALPWACVHSSFSVSPCSVSLPSFNAHFSYASNTVISFFSFCHIVGSQPFTWDQKNERYVPPHTRMAFCKLEGELVSLEKSGLLTSTLKRKPPNIRSILSKQMVASSTHSIEHSIENPAVGVHSVRCLEGGHQLEWSIEGNKQGQVTETLHGLDKPYISSLLQECTILSNVHNIYALIIESGLDQDTHVGNLLINTLGKCGATQEARAVFDKMHARNIISWTSMITAYAQEEYSSEALQLFKQMEQNGQMPNKITFVSALSACASLAALVDGRILHACIVENGYHSDVIVGTALVNMYGKCGAVNDVRSAFSRIHQHDVIAWNAIITVYACQGYWKESFQLFQEMQLEGVKPNNVTYIVVLSACANLEARELGAIVHSYITYRLLEEDFVIRNALLNMYGKCGAFDDACAIFSKFSSWDVGSWNTMITAYNNKGYGGKALQLFWQMHQEGIEPNKITFVSILSTCAGLKDLSEGQLVHACIVANGNDADLIVGTALVSMYGQCGFLERTCSMFGKMHFHNVVSWTTIIDVHTQQGYGNEALELFWLMCGDNIKPNEATFVTTLSACTSLLALEEGRMIHALIIDHGFELNVIVGTALVNMYSKCGSVEYAQIAFDKMFHHDVACWNAMIAACVWEGHCEKSLQLFQQMQQEGVSPNDVTFVNVISACANLEVLQKGESIHTCIIESGYQSYTHVGNALINMYGKCGAMHHASLVFHKMHQCDVVSWNAMMAACTEQGQDKEALWLFQQMLQERMKPNMVTFIIILGAFASLTALPWGLYVHTCIIDQGLESDIAVGTALVYMYGRCGALEFACSMFDKLHPCGTATWNAVICAFAQQGLGKRSLHALGEMQKQGVMPDEVTFVGVLSACSHAGLVDEGCHCFISMIRDHGIPVMLAHYVCMIDLLGRSGRLAEAEDMVWEMPLQPEACIWSALLNASRIHGDVERSHRAAQHMFDLDVQIATPYVVLSNIYASLGR